MDIRNHYTPPHAPPPPGPGNLTRPGITAPHFHTTLLASLEAFAPSGEQGRVNDLRPEKGMIVAITFSAYETAEYEWTRVHEPRYLEAQEWKRVATALNWEFRHLEIPCAMDLSYNDHDRTLWLSMLLGELRREVGMGGRLFIWVGAEGCAVVPEAGWRNGDGKMEGPWIIGYVRGLCPSHRLAAFLMFFCSFVLLFFSSLVAAQLAGRLLGDC